jgi:ELWxxDGT repeat protein
VQLTASGCTLFFRATDGYGDELWKSDGTEMGTVMVADLDQAPGATSRTTSARKG